jgi:hypothetical protein
MAPAAVVATNTDLESDLVNSHVVFAIAEDRRIAVISVTDHGHVLSEMGSMHGLGGYYQNFKHAHGGSSTHVQSSNGISTSSYRQAVLAELHKLNQLKGGLPDVVVCIVNGINLKRDGGGSSGGGGESPKTAILRFAQEMIGVNVFVVTGVQGLATPSEYVTVAIGFPKISFTVVKIEKHNSERQLAKCLCILFPFDIFRCRNAVCVPQ